MSKLISNPAYKEARWEVVLISAHKRSVIERTAQLDYPFRYNSRKAAERHRDTGIPQPGAICPFLETDNT